MAQVLDQNQTELAHMSDEERYQDALRRAGIRPPTKPLRRERTVVHQRPRAVAWLLRLASRVGL